MELEGAAESKGLDMNGKIWDVEPRGIRELEQSVEKQWIGVSEERSLFDMNRPFACMGFIFCLHFFVKDYKMPLDG